MEKILVLCDRIPPEHSATGRFAYHIADELGKNISVYLVCLSDKKFEISANVLIYQVLSRYGKYQNLIKKSANKKGLAKLLYKLRYNIYYMYASKKGLSEIADHKRYIFKTCKRIIKKYGIDIVISSSNPFENQIIAHKIVKKYPKLKWFPYLMDSTRNNAIKPIERDVELKVFNVATKIFIVPAITFDKSFIHDFSDKIELMYLPIIPVKHGKFSIKSDRIIFVYAGMFYKDIRNPKNLLEIFVRLPRNYELRLFSTGCNDVIDKYKNILGERLTVNGFVSPDELTEQIQNCNILLNVCNSTINQIASKIYDMIAYGKPLLNFYQNDKDLTNEHVSKYALSFNAEYVYDDITINKIVDWCEKVKNKQCSYDEATENFADKRLSVIAKKIDNTIRENIDL